MQPNYEQYRKANQIRRETKDRDVKYIGPIVESYLRSGFSWEETLSAINERCARTYKIRTLKQRYKDYMMMSEMSSEKKIVAGLGHEAKILRDQGLTWKQVGEKLGIEPESARKRVQRWSIEDEESYQQHLIDNRLAKKVRLKKRGN